MSHAKTCPTPAKAPALPESVPACGANTPGSLARYDPDTSSWKTSQLCLDGALETFSETWPRSGTMRSGTAFRLPTLVHLTDGIASGSWPTPTAVNIEQTVERWKERQVKWAKRGVSLQFPLCVAVKMWPSPPLWPTPTARDWKDGSARSCMNVPDNGLLGRVVHRWATPTVSGNHNRKGASATSGDGLATQAGGSLNPTWVETLMGFPHGWTDTSDGD